LSKNHRLWLKFIVYSRRRNFYEDFLTTVFKNSSFYSFFLPFVCVLDLWYKFERVGHSPVLPEQRVAYRAIHSGASAAHVDWKNDIFKSRQIRLNFLQIKTGSSPTASSSSHPIKPTREKRERNYFVSLSPPSPNN